MITSATSPRTCKRGDKTLSRATAVAWSRIIHTFRLNWYPPDPQLNIQRRFFSMETVFQTIFLQPVFSRLSLSLSLCLPFPANMFHEQRQWLFEEIFIVLQPFSFVHYHEQTQVGSPNTTTLHPCREGAIWKSSADSGLFHTFPASCSHILRAQQIRSTQEISMKADSPDIMVGSIPTRPNPVHLKWVCQQPSTVSLCPRFEEK